MSLIHNILMHIEFVFHQTTSMFITDFPCHIPEEYMSKHFIESDFY